MKVEKDISEMTAQELVDKFKEAGVYLDLMRMEMLGKFHEKIRKATDEEIKEWLDVKKELIKE